MGTFFATVLVALKAVAVQVALNLLTSTIKAGANSVEVWAEQQLEETGKKIPGAIKKGLVLEKTAPVLPLVQSLGLPVSSEMLDDQLETTVRQEFNAHRQRGPVRGPGGRFIKQPRA